VLSVIAAGAIAPDTLRRLDTLHPEPYGEPAADTEELERWRRERAGRAAAGGHRRRRRAAVTAAQRSIVTWSASMIAGA
jgi:hypothetical protein